MAQPPIMTAKEFTDRVDAARAGDKIVYHIGALAHDAQWSADLAIMRDRAYARHLIGEVSLVQKRTHWGIPGEPYLYQYIAEKRAA